MCYNLNVQFQGQRINGVNFAKISFQFETEAQALAFSQQRQVTFAMERLISIQESKLKTLIGTPR